MNTTETTGIINEARELNRRLLGCLKMIDNATGTDTDGLIEHHAGDLRILDHDLEAVADSVGGHPAIQPGIADRPLARFDALAFSTKVPGWTDWDDAHDTQQAEFRTTAERDNFLTTHFADRTCTDVPGLYNLDYGASISVGPLGVTYIPARPEPGDGLAYERRDNHALRSIVEALKVTGDLTDDDLDALWSAVRKGDS